LKRIMPTSQLRVNAIENVVQCFAFAFKCAAAVPAGRIKPDTLTILQLSEARNADFQSDRQFVSPIHLFGSTSGC
jgi:hypothetical protein